jgi:FADH2-dependent halogenase
LVRLIPISREKVSVGCVLDQQEFAAAKRSPGVLFDEIWRSSPAMVNRMREAQLAGPIQTTSDFSYYNARLAGPRLLRVGDAAGFMDPIFSAGIYLAMFSGKLAAEAVVKALEKNNQAAAVFDLYEKRVRSSMELYWEMVHQFYTTPFLELFFEPREKFHIASAVNALLAGELEGGWRLKWRLRLFFLLVKAQARFGFMPKIRFN